MPSEEISSLIAEEESPSLIIPLQNDSFLEIFPEELPDIPSSTLLGILKDENVGLSVWANVGLAYMQESLPRESSAILQAACERPWGQDKKTRVRILASAGIAHLAASEDKQIAGTSHLYPISFLYCTVPCLYSAVL